MTTTYRPNVCTLCEKEGFEGDTCPCYAAAFSGATSRASERRRAAQSLLEVEAENERALDRQETAVSRRLDF